MCDNLNSNPKDYADNKDARDYDPRLRGPVRPVELEIDYETGMKNYIANEQGDWATSAGYVKYSLARSIHYGRLYTSGGGRFSKGKEEDLCEALRCLGQGLHTLEDWGAHTNYCELALLEMGFHNVFPLTGSNTMMNIRGRQLYPLVTGTFGMVDFFHSVIGEATDQFAQTEITEMDNTLGNAQGSGSSSSQNTLTSLLGKIPGTRDLVAEAEELRRKSEAQDQENRHRSSAGYTASRGAYDQPGGYASGYYEQPRADADSGNSGLNIDPQKTIAQIYPILVFRDKVVRRISSVVEKIPGLESLIEKISDTVTIFVFSLLAPYIRPIINVASKQLQSGSTSVVQSSAEHQYEPWTDPHCTDPTHSLLSKDHFSHILNEPAGAVAASILKFVVPRVLYAWQHTDVPVERVLNDCVSVFHHPGLRDMNNEGHRMMFETMEEWVRSRKDGGASLNDILSSEGVRTGRNHAVAGESHGHGHGHGHSHGHSHGSQSHGYGQSQSGGNSSSGGFPSIPGLSNIPGFGGSSSSNQSSSSSSKPWEQLSNLPGMSKLNSKISSFIPGGFPGSTSRDVPDDNTASNTGQETYPPNQHYQQQPYDQYQAPLQQQQQYQHDQQQPYYPPQQDTGFHVPPPAGYEQYGQQAPAGYQPPSHGAHTYDYYQGPPQGGDGYGYQRY